MLPFLTTASSNSCIRVLTVHSNAKEGNIRIILGIVYIGKLKRLLIVRYQPLGVRLPSFPTLPIILFYCIRTDAVDEIEAES